MDGVEKTERREQLQKHVSDLETFVADALRRGAQTKELKEICEDAVEHSRRKATILQHKDSSLLLNALEQAREEIRKLPEVTATNAEVMQEVEHVSHLKAGSEEVEPSVASVAAPGFLQDRDRPAGLPASTVSSETPSLRSAALPAGATASAAAVVQSLREFAVEVAEEGRRRPGPSLRTLSMSIRRDKSSDFRKSREYDFEAAQSPMASYYMGPEDFDPFRPTSLGSGEIVNAPYSMSNAPITTDYMLSSPRSKAALSLPTGGAFEMSLELSASEGEEEEQEAALQSAAAAGEEGEGEGSRRGAAAAAAGGTRRPVRGLGTPEGTHCAARVPPGINPLAVVEGHSALDNPTTPTANVDLPVPGEEDGFEGETWDEGVGSLTPPKHLLLRLAESIKRMSV